MNNDFQSSQGRRRPGSTDAVLQSSSADVVGTQDDAILAQLAAISGLLQLPVGESPFYTPRTLMESYTQQHPPPLPLSLPGQPILECHSQPFIPPFHSGLHWSPAHQDLYNNLPSAGGSGIASSSQTLQYDVSPSVQSSRESSILNSPISPAVATELAGLDDHVVTEEKRRRNTAASARFRIKKKQRTINLERSVSDLTGRAEELEREAADLRRENGWLKEIVMLKGTRLATLNLTQQLQVLTQNLVDDAQISQISRSIQPSSIEEDHASDQDEDGRPKNT